MCGYYMNIILKSTCVICLTMCVNLQAKVHDLAGDDYRTSVLGPIKECRSRLLFPLQFLNALLSYLGDSGIDYRECLFSRWRFGLEFDSAMKKKELELKFEEIPPQLSDTELGENELSVVDILTSTILSTNFWPPIQDEPLVLPGPVDKLLSDYAKKKVLKVIGKGNLPQVIRIVPYSAIQLFAYETYKKLFSREDGELSVLGSLGAGACAGMTSTLVLAIPWIPFSRNGRLIWTVYP
ncbi:unnamed protein product [Brassica oleracea]|uniref:(rape) hypothetical protein n=1 Tax=Brassica napus TaxID=3708 RepID=A0A816KW41_BRANA|nr:unnamed protein product [Brassica napus]